MEVYWLLELTMESPEYGALQDKIKVFYLLSDIFFIFLGELRTSLVRHKGPIFSLKWNKVKFFIIFLIPFFRKVIICYLEASIRALLFGMPKQEKLNNNLSFILVVFPFFFGLVTFQLLHWMLTGVMTIHLLPAAQIK